MNEVIHTSFIIPPPAAVVPDIPAYDHAAEKNFTYYTDLDEHMKKSGVETVSTEHSEVTFPGSDGLQADFNVLTRPLQGDEKLM